MKITPEQFIENNKDKAYEELLSVRDELIGAIRNYEADAESDPEDVIVDPLPDENYYCKLKLLGSLCNLIAEKYGER